jgi:hypothetical protein
MIPVGSYQWNMRYMDMRDGQTHMQGCGDTEPACFNQRSVVSMVPSGIMESG